MGDWVVEAANDVYDGLEDAYEWIADGDNWENAFKTLTSSIGLLYQGEWEESWELFTNPEAYSGEYHDEQDMKEQMKNYAKQMLKKNYDECHLLDVPVGGRTGSGYTVTSDFNHELRKRESQKPQSMPHSVLSVLEQLVVITLSISLPATAKVLTACILATGMT